MERSGKEAAFEEDYESVEDLSDSEEGDSEEEGGEDEISEASLEELAELEKLE